MYQHTVPAIFSVVRADGATKAARADQSARDVDHARYFEIGLLLDLLGEARKLRPHAA